MTKITKYFIWTSKQYQIDVKEILSVITARERFKAGEKLMEFQNRSLEFTKEFHFLKIYLAGGMDFYDALSLALEDPIMSYIISYEDLDCLFDYLDRKVNFWSIYFNQQIYSLSVVLVTIICSMLIKYLFKNANLYLFEIIFCYILMLLLGYILAAVSVLLLYRQHCSKEIFLRYFDHKISLNKLLNKYKDKDTLFIVNQLETQKINKKENLIARLNLGWKIINFIPYLISFGSIVVTLFFFCINVLNIFQYMTNMAMSF